MRGSGQLFHPKLNISAVVIFADKIAKQLLNMANKLKPRSFFPLVIIFFVVSIVILILAKWIDAPAVDYSVIFAGNSILFLSTLLSFYLYSQSLKNNNIHAFIRVMYGSMLLKMIICIAAVVLYIVLSKSIINKAAIFVCFGLYFIYTFVEVKTLMRISKEQKHA